MSEYGGFSKMRVALSLVRGTRRVGVVVLWAVAVVTVLHGASVQRRELPRSW